MRTTARQARENRTITIDFHNEATYSQLLGNGKAFVECVLVDTIEKGDHSIFIGEVKDAGVAVQPSGRPDDAILAMRDLGDKVFYGG